MKTKYKKLTKAFFLRDVLDIAPELLGKKLIRKYDDGTITEFIITETEAYRGEEDKACHASKGKTSRTQVMYHDGGVVYVYLIYGMYWMLNIVTGEKDNPQAILIRGIEGLSGPGKATKALKIDKTFYGEDLSKSERICIVDAGLKVDYIKNTRVGIDYAGEYWKNKKWRFILKNVK